MGTETAIGGTISSKLSVWSAVPGDDVEFMLAIVPKVRPYGTLVGASQAGAIAGANQLFLAGFGVIDIRAAVRQAGRGQLGSRLDAEGFAAPRRSM